MMSRRLQKFALLAHLTFAVGWLGAVAAYLALAVAGLSGHDAQMARAAYLSMELIGWFVIVPFSLATLLSGLIQSLGTRWGLFRHWWIVAKFLLTIIAIVILLVHMQDVSRESRRTSETTLSSADFRPELLHAGGGLVVLLGAMVLSVFKPWGMTPYGRRLASRADDLASNPSRDAVAVRHQPFEESGQRVVAASTPRWGHIIGIHALVLVLLFAVLHITGLHHH